MKRYRVVILPKEGLLDPQGRAVAEMLQDNGYSVGSVKVGKVVELELPEGVDIDSLARKFLINPLIEDYSVEDIAE